jgi:ubiquinone/menaquinone biosynthesis C-methylase UbiE
MMQREAVSVQIPQDLLRCPACGQGSLGLRPDVSIQCAACSAVYPVAGGVIDLLSSAPPPRRSLAQRLMEAEPVVRIYESRLWRRSAVATWKLGISFEQERDLIMRAANLGEAGMVLDLACGSGIYTRQFAQLVRAGTVVGLDLSLPMLRHASQRVRAAGLGNIVLIHGTALQLPFPAERFDGVNCCGALHLFPDVPRVLHEVQRVLKPGGCFTVAAVHQRGGGLAALGAAYRRRIFGVAAFTPAGLESHLVRAGFEAVQCHFARRLWLIMSAHKSSERA